MSAKNIIMLFPEKSRYKFAEFLGRTAYKLIKKRRLITLDAIYKAFPDKSPDEVKKIAVRSYETMLKTFMMSLWVPDIVGDDSKIRYENFELFKTTYGEGRGVIIATLHMGAFEASLKLAKDYELYDVIKKQRNPLLDKMMNDNRKRTGVNLIYKGKSSLRELVKAIRNKGVVALFSDHYDIGEEVMFFGRKTKASSGAVSLALKYKAPLLIAYNIFDENNNSIIRFDRIMELRDTGDVKEDTKINTQKMIGIFEEIISVYPEQWMWFHRRWRD
jgi:KDO2-lipid IV(A) lauroyltransferase